MMLAQNQMLRANASGCCATARRDPEGSGDASTFDNGENVKSHPNENFGRELLELVHDGRRHYYRARRARGGARVHGWTNDVLAVQFDREQYDFGEKTFLGKDRPARQDVIDTILAQPVTAEIVSGKIYRNFVRDEVPPARRASWAHVPGERIPDQAAAQAHLPVEGLLQPGVHGYADQEPRCPGRVHIQKMGLRELPTIPISAGLTAGLGQALFDPANVAGWAGGRTWITPATLLQRGNLFRDVLFGSEDVPRARPPHAGHLRAGRREHRERDEHHRGHQGRHGRRREQRAARAGRRLQHALRELPRLRGGTSARSPSPARSPI